MLLIKPYPFYLLLKETKVTARTASAISARLAVHLKRNFLIIGWHSYSTLAQETEYVVLDKHLVIVNQRKTVEFAYWIFRCLQVFKHHMIEQPNVNIEQGVQLLGIIELLGNRAFQHFHYVLTLIILAQTVVQSNNLLLLVVVKHFVYNINTPYIAAERENSLNVRFGRYIAVTILVATYSDIRHCIIVAYITLKFCKFHFLSAPSLLRRWKEAACCFKKMLKGSWLRTALSSSKSFYCSQIC